MSEILVVKLGGTTSPTRSRSSTGRGAVASPPAGGPRPRRRQAGHRVARAAGRPDPVRGRPPGHRRRGARGRRCRPARRCQQRAGRRPARPAAATPSGLSGVDGGLAHRRAGAGLGLVATVVGAARRPARGVLVGGQVSRWSRRWRSTSTASSATSTPTISPRASPAGLGARQLVLLTDVDGIRDADGGGSTRSRSTRRRRSSRRRHRRRHDPQGPGRAARGGGRPGAEAIIADSSAPGRPGPRARRSGFRDALLMSATTGHGRARPEGGRER